ncbi:MAG: AI-2E family transporter [Clostridia bacterium]|nr:AI-2E family transporter [Clostridia bacterium]
MNSKKEKAKLLLRQYSKWIIGIAAICILIYLGFANLNDVKNAFSWVLDLFTPLIVGFFMALILNVPMRFFESHLWPKAKKKGAKKLRRPTAFVLSLVVILGIFTGVIILVIPEIVNAVKIVAQGAVGIVNQLAQMKKDEALDFLPFSGILVKINWVELGKSIESWLKAQGGTIVNGAMDTVVSLVGGIIDAVFAVIFSVYILFSKETLKFQAKRLVGAWLPQKSGRYLIHATSVANGVFRNFVAGQTIEAIILGSLCALGMFILRIPYAPMIGALVGVCALIPVVGAFIAGGIGAFMICTESPIKALIFIIFLILLQQIEGNLIYPRVMGNKINLPAIWVLVAVTVGGSVAGPLGILLGIPLASTAYVLLREATENREKKLGLNKTEEITEEKAGSN